MSDQNESLGPTPAPWTITRFPDDPERYFISAPPTPEHPYNGVTKLIEILSDEDYPRRLADAELVVALVNHREKVIELARELKTIGDHLWSTNAIRGDQCKEIARRIESLMM